jgi:hypothetical protein
MRDAAISAEYPVMFPCLQCGMVSGTDQTITIGSIRGRFWEIDYRRYRDQIAGSFAQLSADRDQI